MIGRRVAHWSNTWRRHVRCRQLRRRQANAAEIFLLRRRGSKTLWRPTISNSSITSSLDTPLTHVDVRLIVYTADAQVRSSSILVRRSSGLLIRRKIDCRALTSITCVAWTSNEKTNPALRVGISHYGTVVSVSHSIHVTTQLPQERFNPATIGYWTQQMTQNHSLLNHVHCGEAPIRDSWLLVRTIALRQTTCPVLGIVSKAKALLLDNLDVPDTYSFQYVPIRHGHTWNLLPPPGNLQHCLLRCLHERCLVRNL
jgi:hypothetical protein